MLMMMMRYDILIALMVLPSAVGFSGPPLSGAKSKGAALTLPPSNRASVCFNPRGAVHLRKPQTAKLLTTRLSARRPPGRLPESRGGGLSFADALAGLPVTPILVGVILFAFPGFFVGLFNLFFLGVFVIPALVVFGLNLWAKATLFAAACPSCAAPVQAFKSQREATCFNCGARLVQRQPLNNKSGGSDRTWRLRSRYEDDDDFPPDRFASSSSSSSSSRTGGVIDVESL